MRALPILAPLLCMAMLAAVAPGTAQEDSTPPAHAPSWKYHTYRVQYEVARDGSSTVHYEIAYTVLAETALRRISEEDISYHEHDGALEDVVAYTLKKDGQRIDVPATNVQVTSRNGVNGAAPAFSDYMSRHLVYPDVPVGDTVYLAYTIKARKPTFRNYFSLLTHFSDAYVYDEAAISVTAPKSMGLAQKTYNLDAPSIERVAKDSQRWTWTYRNATARDTRKESGLFDRAWHYRDLPTIELSNFRDYRDIASAYEEEAAKRAQVDVRIRELAAQIAGDAVDRRDQAARIYAWVAKEINFAGNCLSGGDVVPRDTALILNMKMGDCKDHATLLQALLAARGIRSSQVLVNTGEMGYELPEVPCWQAFNHVFNYLPDLDVYADATSQYTPFGTLPSQDRGKRVIHTTRYDGIKQTTTPDAATNFSKTHNDIAVLADGTMQVRGRTRMGGDLANVTSKQFQDWKQSPDFDGGAEYIRRAIEGQGYAGNGSYSGFPQGDGPSDAFGYAFDYTVREYYDTADPHGVDLNAFFPTPNPIAGLVQYAAAKSYDHDFLCGGDTRNEELAITFPDNVRLLAVPRDVHAKTALLSFDATYVREGNTIRVRRSVVDHTPGPICKPEVAVQYAQIGAAIKKDQRAQAVYAPN